LSPHVDELVDVNRSDVFSAAVKDNDVIDLNGTLDYQPHRRPSPWVHLIDLQCQRAGVPNDFAGPECFLSCEELSQAQRLANRMRDRDGGLALIATRTSTPNKEWPAQHWQSLVDKFSATLTWLHVGDPTAQQLRRVRHLALSPRMTIALTNFVDVVVTPDTFLLHASAATAPRRRRVVVLLGSSRPECVSYPSFHNIYSEELDCQPCGRPYSAYDLHFLESGEVAKWPNGKSKKWECEHVRCMGMLSVDRVSSAVQSLLVDGARPFERSLLLIKPDAVTAGHVEVIRARVLETGLRIVSEVDVWLDSTQAQQLYSVHQSSDFYGALVLFMTSGYSHVFIVEGRDAIAHVNSLCGHNDPAIAREGSLRRTYGTSKVTNAVHSPREVAEFNEQLALLRLNDTRQVSPIVS
jgi:nucleoside-diphosphate kinase